jgi:hypothetical protein
MSFEAWIIEESVMQGRHNNSAIHTESIFQWETVLRIEKLVVSNASECKPHYEVGSIKRLIWRRTSFAVIKQQNVWPAL